MNSLFHLAAPEWALLTNPLRLKALSDCGIFATSPEGDFDDIVSIASLCCQCPSAMIAFADGESLHFKSTVGATQDLLQTITKSFFIATVQKDSYVWSSKTDDVLLADCDSNDAKINFYAGVPLTGSDEHIIGVLCVTDYQTKQLSRFQVEALLALSRQVKHQLTLRRMLTVQSNLIVEREKDIEVRRQSETQLAAALSRVSLINEIGKTSRSGAEPATILETAVTKLGVALAADRCYFVTYSPSEDTATVGPDWHVDGIEPISGEYKMFNYSQNIDVTHLTGQTAVVDDVLLDKHYAKSLASVGLGMRSLLRAPVLHGTVMTALGVAMNTPRKWADEEISLVEAIAAQARAAVETAGHTLREKALLRDVLASVTEGKLILVNAPSQLPPTLTPVGDTVILDKHCGLAELRERIRTAGRLADHSETRTFDTMTAASEAGMNAIVHSESGLATVYIGQNNLIQIRIEDQGSGIAFDDLPKATLARGYSTKSTLGHGLKMMLETIDRLFLLTNASGTTVVLEQEKEDSPPTWLTKHHSK